MVKLLVICVSTTSYVFSNILKTMKAAVQLLQPLVMLSKLNQLSLGAIQNTHWGQVMLSTMYPSGIKGAVNDAHFSLAA